MRIDHIFVLVLLDVRVSYCISWFVHKYMHFLTFILELCMLVLMISCSSIFRCLYHQLKVEYNYYFGVILLDFQSGTHGHSELLCLTFFMTGLEKSKPDVPILNNDNLSKAPLSPKSSLVKEIDCQKYYEK
jgi:hypothetical protein